MIIGRKELVFYETAHGKFPFEIWLEGLKDRKARAIIRTRLDRLERGNAGKGSPVGLGVFELKIHYGPGYRAYFGQDGVTLVVLLCGGDKSTQKQDILKAKEYWADYQVRK
ncbi:MAG: type II toxin-antitoxin system RelE/ParE family toxin [Candidatus Omnitrophota bacterium]